MNTENLKDSLKALHANLEATGDVDAELKELLQVLDGDIHLLLTRKQHEIEEAGSLAERVQAISAQFAARHPRIEPALRELGNILANMGI